MNKLLIFPTDTVYGIGCKIFDKANIRKIYDIKKRSYDKPLACLCANLSQIEKIAYVDELARLLILNFLPGPLTLILNAKEEVINKIGYKTIGVRIPACDIAITILEENGPMLTTSVNDSGMPPMVEYNEILEKYSSIVDKIYEPTSKASNLASTVLQIKDGKVNIIREGAISKEMINSILGV